MIRDNLVVQLQQLLGEYYVVTMSDRIKRGIRAKKQKEMLANESIKTHNEIVLRENR